MIQDAWAEVRLHDVRLRWYTPLDVRGVRFNVYRFESEDLEEAGRGELLTIEPLSSQDGAYEFVDTTVRPNRAYEYRMERLADGSAAEIVSTLRVQVGTLESAPVVLEIRPDPVTSPVTVVLEVPVKGIEAKGCLGDREGRPYDACSLRVRWLSLSEVD